MKAFLFLSVAMLCALQKCISTISSNNDDVTTLGQQALLRTRILSVMSSVKRSVSDYEEEALNERYLKKRDIDDVVGHRYHHSQTEPNAEVKRVVPVSSKSLRLVEHLAKRLNLDVATKRTLGNLNVRIPLECPFPPISCANIINDRFRTPDGKCNNLAHHRWGSAATPLPRFLQAKYDDGIDSPRVTSSDGSPLPSARSVSVAIHQESTETTDDRFTHILMQWGQFLDHDMVRTEFIENLNVEDLNCCPIGNTKSVCFPIPISANDPHFSHRCMNFSRSSPSMNLKCTIGMRQQLNGITSFVDASNVYGSSDSLLTKLRRGAGQLKTSGPNYNDLPLDILNNDKCILPTKVFARCSIAGDERVNEQSGLTSLHTLWLREHNRIASQLQRLNEHWVNDRVFNETRKIIGALMQHITYKEFLPLLLGQKAMETNELELKDSGFFKGYDNSCDPSIRNGFATSAYRLGHTLIRDFLNRVNTNYKPNSFSSINLRDAFFRPQFVKDTSQGGVDSIIRGLISQPIGKFDRKISGEVTNHLFEHLPSKIGFDLAARNIQRGRDHGLPPYNAYRKLCKGTYIGRDTQFYMDRARDFQSLSDTHSASVIARLKNIYKSVNDVDAFTGMITEKPLRDAIVGPTIGCIAGRQFKALKKCDRFWYENNNAITRFTKLQLESIRKVTLSGVLCNNHDIVNIQASAFQQQGVSSNPLLPCTGLIGQLDLDPWKQSRNTRFFTDRYYDDLDDTTKDG